MGQHRGDHRSILGCWDLELDFLTHHTSSPGACISQAIDQRKTKYCLLTEGKHPIRCKAGFSSQKLYFQMWLRLGGSNKGFDSFLLENRKAECLCPFGIEENGAERGLGWANLAG